MVVIFGKKSEAQTFSGIELVLFTVLVFVNNYSQDLVIHQLLLDVHQQNLQFLPH
jgi:hypothetical protein